MADADSSQLKAADFYIDPEATPPVRTLRSQSFHISSGASTDVCLQLDVKHFINQSDRFIVAASANQSTESLHPPSHQNSAPPSQYHLFPNPTQTAPNNLPRVLSNPSLLRQSPGPPPAPPSLWPPPDQPFFSLANALSLAMTVAHSFMPPPGSPNQAFHPPPGALPPPVSPSLADPSSPTSFSGPFFSHLPHGTSRPQTSPASSKQEDSPDWTQDLTQVGQVILPVQSAATEACRRRNRRVRLVSFSKLKITFR